VYVYVTSSTVRVASTDLVTSHQRAPQRSTAPWQVLMCRKQFCAHFATRPRLHSRGDSPGTMVLAAQCTQCMPPQERQTLSPQRVTIRLVAPLCHRSATTVDAYHLTCDPAGVFAQQERRHRRRVVRVTDACQGMRLGQRSSHCLLAKHRLSHR